MFDFLREGIGRIVTNDNFLMTALVVPIVLIAERLFAVRPVSARHYGFGILYFVVNATLLGIITSGVSYLTGLGVRAIGPGLKSSCYRV